MKKLERFGSRPSSRISHKGQKFHSDPPHILSMIRLSDTHMPYNGST